MKKLREILVTIGRALVKKNRRLRYHQNRGKANAKRAMAHHLDAIHAVEAAHRAEANGHPKHAQVKQDEAKRSHELAHKYQDRAQKHIAVVKKIQVRIYDLEVTQSQVIAHLAQLKKDHGIRIDGNQVRGATPEKRLVACALAAVAADAAGTRHSFYSQAGKFTSKYAITGEPSGYRSDCSQWYASDYDSCGLPDPNGGGFDDGWTGSLVENGKQISSPKPGCAVIYGSGPGHHVEMYVGPGVRTAGHGSTPVDFGVIDLFNDGDYRFFEFPH